MKLGYKLLVISLSLSPHLWSMNVSQKKWSEKGNSLGYAPVHQEKSELNYENLKTACQSKIIPFKYIDELKIFDVSQEQIDSVAMQINKLSQSDAYSYMMDCIKAEPSNSTLIIPNPTSEPIPQIAHAHKVNAEIAAILESDSEKTRNKKTKKEVVPGEEPAPKRFKADPSDFEDIIGPDKFYDIAKKKGIAAEAMAKFLQITPEGELASNLAVLSMLTDIESITYINDALGSTHKSGSAKSDVEQETQGIKDLRAFESALISKEFLPEDIKLFMSFAGALERDKIKASTIGFLVNIYIQLTGIQSGGNICTFPFLLSPVSALNIPLALAEQRAEDKMLQRFFENLTKDRKVTFELLDSLGFEKSLPGLAQNLIQIYSE